MNLFARFLLSFRTAQSIAVARNLMKAKGYLTPTSASAVYKSIIGFPKVTSVTKGVNLSSTIALAHFGWKQLCRFIIVESFFTFGSIILIMFFLGLVSHSIDDSIQSIPAIS